VELEEVLSIDDGAGGEVIRLVRDDARVPLEVPDRGAAKRCQLDLAEALEPRRRFGGSRQGVTLTTASEDTVTGACR
jgi:hypothetical protein